MSSVQSNHHPGRPRERRVDDALMAAALEVFLERGFNAATIAEIGRRAHIGTPAIYRRWPTKADLAMDVIVQQANPQPIPDSGSLREDLVEFMRQRIRLYRTPLFHQVLLPLLMSGLVHDELQNQITMRSVAYRDQPAMRLHAAIEAGQLRKDASPNRLLDLLAGTLLVPVLFGEELPAVEDAGSIVDQVLAGFAGPAARNKRQAALPPAKSRAKPRRGGGASDRGKARSGKVGAAVSGERGTVLIVEDTPTFAELLAEVVEREGFRPVICGSSAEARSAFKREQPVAVLLDWVLPDAPGTEVCRELRDADPMVTIIFISGRNDETSMARGLDAGADDYVAKPVREGELVARLDAHLRRVSRLRAAFQPRSGPGTERPLQFGELQLDLRAREVRVRGRQVKLGPLEYKLIEYLGRNAGVAVSRDQILSEVHGIAADIGTDRVDLLVRRLRLKLGEYPDTGGHIVALPGYGYMLERRGPE